MGRRVRGWFAAFFAIFTILSGLHGASAQTPDASGEAGLAAIKAYMTEHVDGLVVGAGELETWAQSYYDAAAAVNFDYQALWDANSATLPGELETARQTWTEDIHGNYEMAEGMVAGVPSLASYDVWLDAGPTVAEDSTNAYDWTLTLADGTELVKPGNIFHSITEPALWGTFPDYTGLVIDFNGDGETTLGEALPNAQVLLAGVNAMVDASTQLQGAVAAWGPNLSDAFTALMVMIPTAQGYFEQWRVSPYAVGDTNFQGAFVGGSRLIDVLGIYNGLDVAWTQLSPLVTADNPELADQITNDLAGLIDYVQNLRDQEEAGTTFTPEQAEQFGREVQTQADTVAGNIGQAAALLDIEIQSI